MNHRNSLRVKKSKWILLAALAIMCGNICPEAQLGPFSTPARTPQARTQEELDAYLQIVTGQDPTIVIRNAETFALQYPQSNLLGTAYQYQMLAYEQKSDLQGLLSAGEKALKLQPDNVNILLTVANAIPNTLAGRPDSTDLLARAQEYARRALRGIDQMRIPLTAPLEQWESSKGEMVSRAHEALGQVAMKRNQLPVAVSEFEMAALGNPKPRGSQFYRLGAAYAAIGNNEDAVIALRRAAELGPDALRELAEHELKELTNQNPSAKQPE
jgi:tetratricopeptide (TPR) repeat protein